MGSRPKLGSIGAGGLLYQHCMAQGPETVRYRWFFTTELCIFYSCSVCKVSKFRENRAGTVCIPLGHNH